MILNFFTGSNNAFCDAMQQRVATIKNANTLLFLECNMFLTIYIFQSHVRLNVQLIIFYWAFSSQYAKKHTKIK